MLNLSIAEETKLDLKKDRDMTPFGAFSLCDSVLFSLKLKCDSAIDSVTMVVHKDAWNSQVEVYNTIELQEKGDDTFELQLDFPEFAEKWDGKAGLFYYHYLVKSANDSVTIGGEGVSSLNVIENGIGERQLLLYSDSYKTSTGFSRGVVYHIFVDRFKRSGRCPVKSDAVLDENWESGIPQYGEYPGADVSNNVFFGGDLYGIAEKLDYIAKLGTKTIYLSPVFEAYSNHKYDTGDYLKVDEMFGGDEALRLLCEKAREYDIEVILDGVFNHTGDDSIYFNRYGKYDSVGAYQSENSPYHDWYSFKEFPDEYDCWWGVKILPRVHGDNDDFRSFICGDVVEKWMKMGVSGWRLDVADELDEDFLKYFRRAVRGVNPDGVVIGEVWEDASDKVSYGRRRDYLCGDELDSVMNYPLRSAVIEYVKNGNAELLRKNSEGLYRRYPKCSSDNLMNFLGTHDTERILTILGGEECGDKTNAELSVMRMSEEQRIHAKELLMTAYAIIAGMPGSPCVFYGDEVGLEGYRDPFCRMPVPWSNIDNELLAFYRRIGMIRSDNTVFRDGVFSIIQLDEGMICYERRPFDGNEDYKILVCVARACDLKLVIHSDTAAEELITDCSGWNFEIKKGRAAYIKCTPDTYIDIIK